MANPEYSLDATGRARRDGKQPGSPSRLRRFYFVLASLWGFATGAIGLAAAAKFGGVDFAVSKKVLALLAVSAPVALVGGYIAAEAYREARRRLR
jgi:hypothetical protein